MPPEFPLGGARRVCVEAQGLAPMIYATKTGGDVKRGSENTGCLPLQPKGCKKLGLAILRARGDAEGEGGVRP